MSYGRGRVPLEVEDRLAAGPWRLEAGADAASDPLPRAVEELVQSGWPEACEGRVVGLLLPDGTRSWEPRRLLPPLGAALAGARSVQAFLCTGTHDPRTPENVQLARRVGEALAGTREDAVEVVLPDARRDRYASCGTTSRGTPVELHERASEPEVLLALSDMKPHYFAGYSNPSKYVVPGLASLATARGNHSLALEEASTFGRHPWHPDPARRSNPLAEDLVEALSLGLTGRRLFALTQGSAGGRVLWAAGGTAEEAAGRGMAEVDRRTGRTVDPVRFLVVSAGGAPLDESLYTAQRALELSAAAVRDGGEVLFLAECPNGIGPPSAREVFFEPLARPLHEITAPARSDYVLYAHKPVKMARYLERLGALHVHSRLPADQLARVHMCPAAEPQAVLDAWTKKADPGDRIGFLDDASKQAVYVPMP